MNKQDIIKALNKYHFDMNEYMVISGASMVLQGIKETTKDIDIAVSKKYVITSYSIHYTKLYENRG